jgi:hypothetical protein
MNDGQEKQAGLEDKINGLEYSVLEQLGADRAVKGKKVKLFMDKNSKVSKNRQIGDLNF